MRRFAALLSALLVLALSGSAGAGETKKSFWFFSKAVKHQVLKSRQIVSLQTAEPPGTIIIETTEHALYFLLPGGKAVRYPVGVGRDGYGWRGTAHVARRAQWPEWHPPREMIERAAARSQFVPYSLEGGRWNPLGARALYLYQGTRDTLYRIHGTNEPRSIGRNVTSGCIRMLNEDVIDLYDRVAIGAKVIVR
ncbi:MAG TPA: L,D-transpeptidase [Aestuariivirgaceae bacterium]|jgi:lipoprotein-anchoring transpeptidase ErfK/SrfK